MKPMYKEEQIILVTTDEGSRDVMRSQGWSDEKKEEAPKKRGKPAKSE